MIAPSLRRGLVAAGLTVLLALPAQPAAAQGTGAGAGGPGALEQPGLAEGQPVGEVRILAEGVPAAAATALAERARHAFGFVPGVPFNAVLADIGLGRVRALEGVRDATWRLARGRDGEAVTLELRVAAGPATPAPSGLLAPAGGWKDFPVVYKDEKSLLRVTLNGGLGAFSEGNAWFGRPRAFTLRNPLVADPAQGARTGARTSWFESYVEYGLGGATRIGSSPFYVYGAVSGVSIGSTGQDIFRSDTRTSTNVEKLYGGLIYAPPDSDLRINASVGR